VTTKLRIIAGLCFICGSWAHAQVAAIIGTWNADQSSML
jgi:hypothetical protein